MKLSALDTASPAEEGRFLHLKHPAHGHPMYVGPHADPHTGKLLPRGEDEAPLTADDLEEYRVGLTIRGWFSDTVQGALGLMNAKDMQEEEDLSPKLKARKNKERGDALALAIVAHIHNIEGDDGKPLHANLKGVQALFDRSPRLQKQALAFSKDDGNYFTDALPTLTEQPSS